MREVKDPFRAAAASRQLPQNSKIQVVQVGKALSEEMDSLAQSEVVTNLRYRWLGEQPRWKAVRTMARSRLMVLSSVMEGGANVVCEALACSVPVISTHISGSIGLLGEDYPGYFPVGDTKALADLMSRAETDVEFYEDLRTRCIRQASLIDPAEERKAWENLLGEMVA